MTFPKIIKTVGDIKLIMGLYFVGYSIVGLAVLWVMKVDTISTVLCWKLLAVSVYSGCVHRIFLTEWTMPKKISIHGALVLSGTIMFLNWFGWLNLKGVASWAMFVGIFALVYVVVCLAWFVYYWAEKSVLNEKLGDYQKKLQD